MGKIYIVKSFRVDTSYKSVLYSTISENKTGFNYLRKDKNCGD